MTLADFLVVSVEVVVDLLSIWQVSCTLAALFSWWFPSLGSRSGFPLLPMNPFLMRSNNWEIKMQLVWWASPLESLGRWCGKAFIHIRHSFLGGYRQFYIASHMNSPLVRTIRQERSTIHPIFLHCGLTLPYSFLSCRPTTQCFVMTWGSSRDGPNSWRTHHINLEVAKKYH